MADAEKFKVFISWSGSPSKEIAKLLESWLPDIFDNIAPWVSDTGIEPGARSYGSIADALANAKMGIIVATKANQQAPWITYEAGALSNLFSVEQSRVVPLLVDFATQSELTSPLSQFQNCSLNEAGMEKLCRQISKLMGSSPENIAKRVSAFWKTLKDGVNQAIEDAPRTAAPVRKIDDVLDDILSTVRAIARSGETNIVVHSYANNLQGRPGQLEELLANLLKTASLPAVGVSRRGTLDGIDYVNVDVLEDVDESAVQRFLQLSSGFKGVSFGVTRVSLLPSLGDEQKALEETIKNLTSQMEEQEQDEERRRFEEETEMMKQVGLPTDGR